MTVTDVRGYTAARFAREAGHADIVELLALASRDAATAGSAYAALLQARKDAVTAQCVEEAQLRLGHTNTTGSVSGANGGTDTVISDSISNSASRRPLSPLRAPRLSGSTMMPDAARDWRSHDDTTAAANCGDSDDIEPTSSDTAADTGSTAVAVTGGGHHSSALSDRGTVRCHKCTLPVPCLHYSSVADLLRLSPSGPGVLPEWRWSRKPVVNSRRIAALARARAEAEMPLWRQLHRANMHVHHHH